MKKIITLTGLLSLGYFSQAMEKEITLRDEIRETKANLTLQCRIVDTIKEHIKRQQDRNFFYLGIYDVTSLNQHELALKAFTDKDILDREKFLEKGLEEKKKQRKYWLSSGEGKALEMQYLGAIWLIENS